MGLYNVGDVVEVMLKCVEFHHLLNSDGLRLLRNVIVVAQIRPVAPFIAQIDFGLYDLVDVFVNDGWWTGRIIDVFSDDVYYEVYFELYNEALDHVYYEMRPYLDGVGSNWVGFFR
ncbi:protein AGENET DOMAIN (AGD)-CONTAINING P1-like [Silene latifolia]|uniref:protein AGENET DOMAIN (AGD)-CONTAINING P1-like n=1 Tax=Silene latifolia TaxID=37657 RepID=UPI003D781AFA